MENWRDILAQEFSGEEGTVRYRIYFGGWDEAAYQRLIAAMRTCCEVHEEQDTVERWIADGFYGLARLGVQEDRKIASYPLDAAVEFDALAVWLFNTPAND